MKKMEKVKEFAKENACAIYLTAAGIAIVAVSAIGLSKLGIKGSKIFKYGKETMLESGVFGPCDELIEWCNIPLKDFGKVGEMVFEALPELPEDTIIKDWVLMTK